MFVPVLAFNGNVPFKELWVHQYALPNSSCLLGRLKQDYFNNDSNW